MNFELWHCSCLSSSLAQILRTMTGPKPKQAILIQRQWVNKIFDPDSERRKTWEIRSFNAEKRGLFAVGVTGESKLEGEVELVNSFRVAEKVDGKWQPVNDENKSELKYLFSPGNYFKAGFNEQSASAYLQTKPCCMLGNLPMQ